jgi:hypothetical protein
LESVIAESRADEWLVLIHQIPPKSAYLRVKVGRRLVRIGAVALKNSVYLLPATDACQEDFQWVLREVKSEGGDATLLRAQVVDGLGPDELRALFNAERERDYCELLQQAHSLVARVLERAEQQDVSSPNSMEAEVARLERQLEHVVERDFFGARGREAVSALLQESRSHLAPPSSPPVEPPALVSSYRGRTWVTRKGVHVDRIASAWLIRTYIDPDATFKFVPFKDYKSGVAEVCFDMFEAEFTHDGNACTFEVLCRRFELQYPGLAAVAELVHDLDIKDERYNRPETAGFRAQILGIALLHETDEARIAHGTTVLDALVSYYASKERA